MTERIAIIGAGIGGLTTALTLKRKGYEATVYESAPEIKPVGAGIIMANNAMQIFRNLGIHEKIEKAGNKVSSMQITDEKLTILSLMDLAKFEDRYGVYNVAIHRAELQKILAEEIGLENIRLSKRLTKIERDDTFKLTFDDNTLENVSTILGADGIKSTVRNQLFNTTEIRDAKQVCWRGVCEIDLPERLQNTAVEAWGKGNRFGFVQISNKKVYWYAVVKKQFEDQGKRSLSDLLKSYHTDILKIIAATPDTNIFFSKITDLKPIKKWQNSNVCLIGDAAHATTPNLGQGACQAIEDAYAIGQLLKPGKQLENVFAEYEKLRIKKAHNIVNTSWRVGQLAHIDNSLGIWLRNTMMKASPKSMNNKQLESIFDIEYLQ